MSNLRPLRPPRRIVYLPRTLGGDPAPPDPPTPDSRTEGPIPRLMIDRDVTGGSPRKTKQRD